MGTSFNVFDTTQYSRASKTTKHTDSYFHYVHDQLAEFSVMHSSQECEVVYQGCVEVRRTSKNGRSKSGGARCHHRRGCCWR